MSGKISPEAVGLCGSQPQLRPAALLPNKDFVDQRFKYFFHSTYLSEAYSQSGYLKFIMSKYVLQSLFRRCVRCDKQADFALF